MSVSDLLAAKIYPLFVSPFSNDAIPSDDALNSRIYLEIFIEFFIRVFHIQAELTPKAIADAPPVATAAETETVASPHGTNSAPALIIFSFKIF